MSDATGRMRSLARFALQEEEAAPVEGKKTVCNKRIITINPLHLDDANADVLARRIREEVEAP